jgi:hypothetical protein
MRPAGTIARNFRKRAGQLEFDGGAQGIANGQTNERAALSVC